MAESNAFSLPTEIEGITSDWLETALSGYAPGVRVRGFEKVDFINTTCTKIRLKLDLENNREDAPIPETVILKGGFEPHSRAMWTMHFTETHSYSTLMPAAGMRTPVAYFSEWDEAAKQGIVIMEDLVARGVEFCSPIKPQGFEEIARRLKELARLHALDYGSKELDPGGRWDWLDDTPANLLVYFDHFLQPDIWNDYLASPRGAAVSTRFHDRHWMRDALAKTGVFSRGLPYATCHGDTHLGNLYIDIDGEPGFFDSLPHISAAMQEITYHITNALDVPDRRAHERDLVAHYRYELASHGVEVPSLDELMRQFGIFLANGYMIFIVNASEFQPEAINTAYTARYSAAMLDHDTMGLIAELG